MTANRKVNGDKPQKHRRAQEAAARLRQMILDNPPGAQLGSLREVADEIGVGIVTVQQAARVLEHEGLLAVKRGPGGGYYGARPDESALERAFDTYIRVHGFGYLDAMELMVLLDCEFIPRAASSQNEEFFEALAELVERLEHSDASTERVQIEIEFRDLLFTTIDRPLIRLLARVTMHTTEMYQDNDREPLFSDSASIAKWKQSRRRIFRAILERDAELARFEAERFRDFLLPALR